MAVAYETVSTLGAQYAHSTTPRTWSHAGGTGPARIAVLYIESYTYSSGDLADWTLYDRTVTYGGVAMTSIGGGHPDNDSTLGWAEVYVLLNPPSGTQTVSVTVNGGNPTFCFFSAAVMTFAGVGGYTPLAKVFGPSGTALSLAVNSDPTYMVVCNFSTEGGTTANPQSPTYTQTVFGRVSYSSLGNNYSIGYTQGASPTKTVGVTSGNQFSEYLGFAFNLTPYVATGQFFSFFDSM